MSIQDIGALGEFFGSTLILITLIYLAIQNKHQQKLLLSSAFHAKLEPMAKYVGWRVENPQFAEVLRKSFAGESLAGSESLQLEAYTFFGLAMLENAMYQKELGALDVSDRELESQTKIILLETSKEHLQRWRELGYFRPSFQAEIDRFLSEEQTNAH